MSDIKLFQLNGEIATELGGKSAQLEKDLQNHGSADWRSLFD